MTTNPWMPHSGGPCPLAVPSRINIRCSREMRDDGVYPLDDAVYNSHEDQLDWEWDFWLSGDIIAYRIVS